MDPCHLQVQRSYPGSEYSVHYQYPPRHRLRRPDAEGAGAGRSHRVAGGSVDDPVDARLCGGHFGAHWAQPGGIPEWRVDNQGRVGQRLAVYLMRRRPLQARSGECPKRSLRTILSTTTEISEATHRREAVQRNLEHSRGRSLVRLTSITMLGECTK